MNRLILLVCLIGFSLSTVGCVSTNSETIKNESITQDIIIDTRNFVSVNFDGKILDNLPKLYVSKQFKQIEINVIAKNYAQLSAKLKQPTYRICADENSRYSLAPELAKNSKPSKYYLDTIINSQKSNLYIDYLKINSELVGYTPDNANNYYKKTGGFYFFINQTHIQNSSISWSYVIIHEMGHVIGLSHKDWGVAQEGNDLIEASKCFRTDY